MSRAAIASRMAGGSSGVNEITSALSTPRGTVTTTRSASKASPDSVVTTTVGPEWSIPATG